MVLLAECISIGEGQSGCVSLPSVPLCFFLMGEVSPHEPLLSDGRLEHGSSKRKSFMISLAKWMLKSVMWLIFIIWVAVIFFSPTELVKDLFTKLIIFSKESVLGITGRIFLVFSGPILIIAFLGYFYITAFPSDNFEEKKSKSARFRLWTFPVIIDGPLGVVSAAELIGILLFSVYVLWNLTAYTIEGFKLISKFPELQEKIYLMLDVTGLRLGSIGLFCMVFLFLPVSRGSILLRLIDIPFEHATRYHVWLGHLTMVMFTLHGIFFMISWGMQGNLSEKMLEWKDIGVAILPGVISLLAGLLMWVTSLHPVRKCYFELFFYTHQLYVVFIVFLALHVGDFIFSMAAGAIFLFILDRFLRFCQSRPTVNIISAACRPCGTVELILSKPPYLRYNALSFVFLQVRELSWLQWHPFSVSSSPLDGRYHVSVLIKVLGKWTGRLRDIISSVSEHPTNNPHFQPRTLTASVEGPYGHESPYHLMYENLILVAGGIGISPFLAILSDILHRIREGKPCLPKHVLVIWAVKKSKELSLLSAVDAQSLFPSFPDKLNLDIQAYVTQESEPPVEDGKLEKGVKSTSFFTTKGSSMSSLVGTGNNVWSAIYLAMSTIGFIAFYGLVEVYYTRPYNVKSWWYLGLLFIACMVASVVIVGGAVIFLWDQWEKRSSICESAMTDDENDKLVESDEPLLHCETGGANLASLQTTLYGCRPDFQAIFSSYSKAVGCVDVGVIVCGPPTLQSSVAKECRSQNLSDGLNKPVFHFNSHSFDL